MCPFYDLFAPTVLFVHVGRTLGEQVHVYVICLFAVYIQYKFVHSTYIDGHLQSTAHIG